MSSKAPLHREQGSEARANGFVSLASSSFFGIVWFRLWKSKKKIFESEGISSKDSLTRTSLSCHFLPQMNLSRGRNSVRVTDLKNKNKATTTKDSMNGAFKLGMLSHCGYVNDICLERGFKCQEMVGLVDKSKTHWAINNSSRRI